MGVIAFRLQQFEHFLSNPFVHLPSFPAVECACELFPGSKHLARRPVSQTGTGSVVEGMDVQFRLDGQERRRHGWLPGQQVFDLRLRDFDAAVVLGIVAGTVDGNNHEGFK